MTCSIISLTLSSASFKPVDRKSHEEQQGSISLSYSLQAFYFLLLWRISVISQMIQTSQFDQKSTNLSRSLVYFVLSPVFWPFENNSFVSNRLVLAWRLPLKFGCIEIEYRQVPYRKREKNKNLNNYFLFISSIFGKLFLSSFSQLFGL